MNTYISASAWPSHLLCPSLNHKKVSPFTKIRPDHITVCACFWILTVTVPDPGLNGNLASGPFGFLIEYPCRRWSYLYLKVVCLTSIFLKLPRNRHCTM